MSGSNSDPAPSSGFSFEFKRAVVGGVSLACFLAAGLIYATSSTTNNVLLAAAIRIGIVLFACWLAMPQLRGLLAKVSGYLPMVALVLIAVCAANPNLFRVIGSLIVIGGGVMAVSNWLKTITKKNG